MLQLSELDRIKILITWLIGRGFAPNQEALGVLLGYKSKSSFSQILNGHVPLPKKFIESLYKLDSSINKSWLLTGEGEMLLKQDKEYPVPEVKENVANEPPGNPYIDNQSRLIRMQEQLLQNNTRLMAGQEKLIDANSKLAAQIIELCSKNPQNEILEKLEAFSKEFQEFRAESKNAPAREDVGCADVG